MKLPKIYQKEIYHNTNIEKKTFQINKKSNPLEKLPSKVKITYKEKEIITTVIAETNNYLISNLKEVYDKKYITKIKEA